MHIFRKISEFQVWRKSQAAPLALVPTMGALHRGHGYLIEQAVLSQIPTVVSIFVNPMQFNQSLDLQKYPRTEDADFALCKNLGVEAVLAPEPTEIYPHPFFSSCEVSTLDKTLCGATRPGHFRGVCTVVLKLFNITQASLAYFGTKDFQQLRIIEQMVYDFNLPLSIIRVPTQRESTGLALSSRNTRLSPEERTRATCLYAGLQKAADLFKQGERNSFNLCQAAEAEMQKGLPFTLDYLSIVDQKSLQNLTYINQPALMALAAFFGEVRLIDNVELVP